MQQLVVCLNCLSLSIWLDIATITKMLSKYTHKLKDLGISFSNQRPSLLEAFIKFPINNETMSVLFDCIWGFQDKIFKNLTIPSRWNCLNSRSISGFLIYFMGPIHWTSKHQSITAQKSAKTEIYVTK